MNTQKAAVFVAVRPLRSVRIPWDAARGAKRFGFTRRSFYCIGSKAPSPPDIVDCRVFQNRFAHKKVRK